MPAPGTTGPRSSKYLLFLLNISKYVCWCQHTYFQIFPNMFAGAGTGHYWTWLTPESRVCTAPPSYALTTVQHNLKQHIQIHILYKICYHNLCYIQLPCPRMRYRATQPQVIFSVPFLFRTAGKLARLDISRIYIKIYIYATKHMFC